MAPRYNITNVAVIGCLYLPSGVGSIVGSRLGGRWADRTTARWIKKRGYRESGNLNEGGVAGYVSDPILPNAGRPEDRLYSTLIGGILIFPASVIGAGWTMQTGKGGIALPCVFLCEFEPERKTQRVGGIEADSTPLFPQVLAGVGQMFVLASANT
jgi:hypothetical protein